MPNVEFFLPLVIRTVSTPFSGTSNLARSESFRVIILIKNCLLSLCWNNWVSVGSPLPSRRIHFLSMLNLLDHGGCLRAPYSLFIYTFVWLLSNLTAQMMLMLLLIECNWIGWGQMALHRVTPVVPIVSVHENVGKFWHILRGHPDGGRGVTIRAFYYSFSTEIGILSPLEKTSLPFSHNPHFILLLSSSPRNWCGSFTQFQPAKDFIFI